MTVIVGDNAQGKSNLLESIYFLAGGKSPRVDKDFQLIKDGEKFTYLEGEIENNQQTSRVVIGMQKVSDGHIDEKIEKKFKLNGLAKRITDYAGELIVVYFSPEDINLILGSPADRRSYIDNSLSQIDLSYRKDLIGYNESLTSRNRLLKRIREGTSRLSELEYWTLQIIDLGQKISRKRSEFIDSLNQKVKMLGESEGFLPGLQFVHQPNVISIGRINEYLSKEIEAGMSLVGPHRDDFLFQANNKNLAYYGSRGEMRTAVLDLKLAQRMFIKDIKGLDPILLLDDIFSELDQKHRDYVISMVDSQQTFLSVINILDLPKEFLNKAKVIKIEKGDII